MEASHKDHDPSAGRWFDSIGGTSLGTGDEKHMPDEFDLSRRKALAALGTVGAASASAGLGTSAFFSDQETFENNQLDAGEFDLKVDWEVNYYDWLAPDPETISDSDTDDDGDLEFVDDPGPIVDLEDVKPGDVIEHTISLHLFGNPGFIAMDGLLTADSDNGFTEPENDVDGTTDDADGTPDGDLDDHLQCVVWFDDGDGLPQEIWSSSFPQTEEFLRELTAGNDSFDRTADEFLFQGTVASLMSRLSGGLLLDPGVTGHVANEFADSFCFAPSTTQYIGILCWLPRDIPGVDDNIVQSDRLEYELGFNANQCRHNVADDGRPVDKPTDLRTKQRVEHIVSIFLEQTSVNSFISLFGPVNPGTVITSAASGPNRDPAELTVPQTSGEYYLLIVDEKPTKMFEHPMRYAWVDVKSETVGMVKASERPMFMQKRPVTPPRQTGFTNVQGNPVSYWIELPDWDKIIQKDVEHDISSKGNTSDGVPSAKDCTGVSNCKFALVMDFGDAEYWAAADLAAEKAAEANQIANWLKSNNYRVQRISQYWGNDIPALTTGSNPSQDQTPMIGDKRPMGEQLGRVFSAYEQAFRSCCQGEGKGEEASPETLHFFLYITSHTKLKKNPMILKFTIQRRTAM